MNTQWYKNWIGEVFDRSAKEYGQKYNTFFDYFAKKLIALANLPTGARVLDVATGRGAILQQVADIVGPQGHVVGIDISTNMIKETATALSLYANIDLICMDAENLTFANNSFDYIFCGFGVFFFPDLHKAVQEFFRVLKPGGKIFISTWGAFDHNSMHPFFYTAYSRFNVDVKILPNNFKHQDLAYALVAQGFTAITAVSDQLDYVYPTLDDCFNSLWTHAPRGKLEKLNTEQIEQLKKSFQKHLIPLLKADGFHEILNVHYTHAIKEINLS